jgi:hypothetical protein
MLPVLILPILNLLGIKVFPGQDAWSLTVPFDKNKHYSMSAISILCCCLMITNIMRKTLIGMFVPLPLKPLGYASLAMCILVSFLLTFDTYHRVLGLIQQKKED